MNLESRPKAANVPDRLASPKLKAGLALCQQMRQPLGAEQSGQRPQQWSKLAQPNQRPNGGNVTGSQGHPRRAAAARNSPGASHVECPIMPHHATQARPSRRGVETGTRTEGRRS